VGNNLSQFHYFYRTEQSQLFDNLFAKNTVLLIN